MRKIILASQSPRRKELLAMMGLQFEVVPSDFEEYLNDKRSPETVAEELALGKALVVSKLYPEAIVIGSDTIVTLGNRQLAKPETKEEALAMLRAATLTPNKVTSSLAVLCQSSGVSVVTHENSWVHFKSFDKQLTLDYLETNDYKDKAGAYGVQSGAAPLIEYITGHFDTIVGLPTHKLAEVLHDLGIQSIAVD